MANLFQKLEQEAFRAGITPRTKESVKWFKNRISSIRGVNRRSLMREDPIETTGQVIVNNQFIGTMMMYFYDPKHKQTLPYYDRFPLVIVVGRAEGGFYGLNLHYLPITLRAKFLDSLLEFTTNKRFDESTKFRTRYNFLQRTSKLKYFRPCLKHYLTKNIKGRVAIVQAPEWEIATFLPTQDFRKSSQNSVWSDSRKIISG